MSERLNKLYSTIIKEHNETPTHFEKREGLNVVTANNSICGDRFEFYINADQKKIAEIHFHGFGCAVSKASGSILIKLLEGKSIEEGIKLCDKFISYLNRESLSVDKDQLEDFEAFKGIWEFPARYDCAALAWQEVRMYLQSVEKV